MTQNTSRQEPTFGEPASEQKNTETTSTTNSALKSGVSFSIHTKNSPGHTFTPVLKRPAELAQHVPTLEEQSMLKTLSSQAETATVQPSQATISAQPRNFAFTPSEPEIQPEQQSSEEKPSTSAAENTQSAETAVLRAEPLFAKPTADKTAINSSENTSNRTADTADTLERVIPNQSAATAKKSSPTERIPPQYRRLLLVLLLALALVLVFFLLKPKTPETVDELQQGTSLPIEFRPVDEAEAKRAEEEAKALALQAQAQAEAERLAQQQAAQAVKPAENSAETNNTANATIAQPTTNEQNVASSNTQNQMPMNTAVSESVPQEPVRTEPVKSETVKVVAAVEPVKKPATSGSVIYQPEKVAPVKAEKVEKAEKSVKSEKADKPQAAVKKPEPKAQTANVESVSAASSKTLTMQKGVTLFQNFRDNGLGDNLPELNKMTKLNGKTNELQPGQKIVVRLDSQKRIVEMNIGSGKYLRQADGSYIYK